jgi:hypothetical protein
MKLAIGYRIQQGPWGGGNRFAQSLSHALISAGHSVVFDLQDPDIDLILLTDPRPRSPSVSFSAGAILVYLTFKNSTALVIHRINECDERKGTKFMNAALVRANWCADFTVFVGSWLTDLPVWKKHLRTPYSVILNGADSSVFNTEGFQPWHGSGPLRLVTHHWGGNWMKGFDIYQHIDRMLAEPTWKERLEFTYIGNLPAGFRFQNARHIAPLNGIALAAEIKRHHAYITASINEPGGNHQNEAGACGLPLLYRRSGCLPEYCAGFGISFDENDFESALAEMFGTYANLIPAMENWPHLSPRTCAEYIQLFESLVQQRKTILSKRHLWRNPWLMLRNQIPL